MRNFNKPNKPIYAVYLNIEEEPTLECLFETKEDAKEYVDFVTSTHPELRYYIERFESFYPHITNKHIQNTPFVPLKDLEKDVEKYLQDLDNKTNKNINLVEHTYNVLIEINRLTENYFNTQGLSIDSNMIKYCCDNINIDLQWCVDLDRNMGYINIVTKYTHMNNVVKCITHINTYTGNTVCETEGLTDYKSNELINTYIEKINEFVNTL